MTRVVFFIVFMVFVALMLALDLGVFHKNDREIKFKEAAIWTGVWIMMGLAWALLILLRAEWVHGIAGMSDLLHYIQGTPLEKAIDASMAFPDALRIYRKEMAGQFLAGYFLEKSLSIDNIFVMIMIFVSFGIDKKYYHRVLFWGVLGAIVLRFIFIFALGAIVERISWILAVFGVILIYSGVKMFKDNGDEQIDTASHPIVRFASKHFRVTPNLDGHNFFTKIDGKNFITPLFLVLLVIEFSDVIFAVDSIPAVFSITTDTFIVFFSNIMAILGLRSLFFMMSSVNDKFWLLRYGLGVLLCFIGLKMIGHEFFHISISTGVSLCVILGILLCSMLLSVVFPKKVKTE